MATALVTGATAGIGAAYTELLAKAGFDLVLVARDLPRLNTFANKLKKSYKIKVETIKADLTKPVQLAKVEKRLANASKPIEVLINNAGFGIKDSFLDSDLKREQELLDVEYLNNELKGTKVKVSALCPGFTRTEFHQRGKMRMTGLPNFMWLDANKLVAKSWSDAQKNKVVSVPGFQYKTLAIIAQYSPRPLVRKIGISVRKKQR